jgi:aldose 1-epimerase
MISVVILFSCVEKKDTNLSGLDKSSFVTEHKGKPTALYVLRNGNSMEVCITNYGGRIVSIVVPDRNGAPKDVVLGHDKIDDYTSTDGNFGALIGRYGNRIAQGKFTLDGVEYRLPRNNNGHCLHGGPEGFHVRVWDATQPDAKTLVLKYTSADGEAGFPGTLESTVTYTLTDDNALKIHYEATTDKPTVVNLTNHSYFNLSGDAGSTILDHIVTINADSFTAVDNLLIPYEIASVEGTPLDFRQPVAIGARIDDSNEQLLRGRGYDHNWILNTDCDINKCAATVKSPVSSIVLEVYTNEPGVQFYTGNFMSGKDVGKFGVVYPHRGALCLETQHYPDSPNHPDFPSTVLRPGEKYVSECIYKFSVAK